MDKMDKSLDEIIASSGGTSGPARRGRSYSKTSPYSRPNRGRGGGRGGFRGGRGGYGGGVGRGGGGGARVYVGNLNWNVSWQDLKDHMRQAGNVLHADILEFPDGRSKGCAIVEFDNRRASQRAIQELTDTMLNDRKIFVREDREPTNAGQQQFQQQQYRPQQQVFQQQEEPAYKAGSFVAQKIRSSMPAGCQVYLGNLPWSVKWQDLKDICSEYGEVIRADVSEEPNGRSKGFGTVVFSKVEEADACIATLNEAEHEGRKLIVRKDGRATGPGCKVYVGNLPWSASWQDLKDLGKEFGDVAHSDVIMEPNGRSKGFGILTFTNDESATACIEGLNGREFEGRALAVREDARA